MDNFLGEKEVNKSETMYADYTRGDWIMLWIEKNKGYDGDHHKHWLVDQIARMLKGTRIIIKKAEWKGGLVEMRFSLDEPTDEYWKWVEEMRKPNEKGEYEYDYDFGIAP